MVLRLGALGLNNGQRRTLQAAQNKLLRWVVGDSRREKRSCQLHRETGMLTINQAIMYKILARGMKILKNQKPMNLYSMLTSREETHEKQLRSRMRMLNDPRNGRYYDRTWKNQFLQIFPMLPKTLQEANMGKKSGKTMLRSWVKSNVEDFV